MGGRPKYQAVSQGWKWPKKIDSKSVKRVPERKVFARWVSSNNTELHGNILKGILDRWQQTEKMVLASEEFDRFGTTPWSRRDGMEAIRKIVDRVKPPRLDIVVNYRMPRHTHWISVWKQLTAFVEVLYNKENTDKLHMTDGGAINARFDRREIKAPRCHDQCQY
jgi:hypothetical protein